MSETTLRKYLGRLLNGHTSQIESHATSAGIPDTNNHQRGRDIWVECKYGHPSKHWDIRKTQKSWMRRRIKAGATNIFIIWRYESPGLKEHGVIWVNEGNMEAIFSNVSLSSWREHSVRTWGREIPRDELNTIVGVL